MARPQRWIILWLACLGLTGCDGCSGPADKPAPAAQAPVSMHCQVVASFGHALGNAAAGPEGLVVAGPGGVAHFVGEASEQTLRLGAEKIGGVYHHSGVYYLMDGPSSRIIPVKKQDGQLQPRQVINLESPPRIAAFSGEKMRVVPRGQALPYLDVDLPSGTAVPVAREDAVVADIEWYKGAFYEAWIGRAKVGEIDVAPEPYRLHAAASGLYAMHASTAQITRVDDQAVVQLAGTPLRMTGDLVALISGSGKVQVIRDMEVVATHEVPPGSHDLAVLEGVAAISSGSSGTIHLRPVAPDAKIDIDKVEVPFSVGRLYASEGILWAIGPMAGRVARCELN